MGDLGASIRRVAERAEEQWQVEMLVRVAHGERDLDLGEKRDVETLAAMKGADVEGQAVGARRYGAVGQRVDAPLLVGRAAANRRPLARVPEFEDHGDSFCRRATGDVEN